MTDDNPRPTKRLREGESPILLSSGLSDSPNIPPLSQPLTPLPPASLLLSLPLILAHPPGHRYYVHSLYLSLISFRKCLALDALGPDVECRAWTGLAEVGMRAIASGFSQSEEHRWARGIEDEVERAIGKALLISQKHSSLRMYHHHLTLLHAHFSAWQQNTKFSRSLLRRLTSSFTSSDPPHIIYATHLATISLISQDARVSIQALHDLAAKKGHAHVQLLASVLRVRILISTEAWGEVATALSLAEASLGLSYLPKSATGSTTFVSFDNPFEASMAAHTILMGVIFYTHAGIAEDASLRLSHLHALLDEGVLEKTPDGIVQISLPSSPPLLLQMTHPRVFFLLAFLVSAVSKRDAVGRKPKRKVFANEGIVAWEREFKREIALPVWASTGDLSEVEGRLSRLKADLLCELVGISILRSEFDSAKQTLALLVAHARTYNIFAIYAARIALHHAHLAHALGQAARALECYRVAAFLADDGSFEAVSATAGEVAMRIGLKKAEKSEIDAETRAMGVEVISACKGMGATLEAVARVIEAALCTEILRAKQNLKYALSLVSKAQDNHLRALILALIASHYFHTAAEHAQTMLMTCEQLAAGLGAGPNKSIRDDGKTGDEVGNAPLRLWIGERFLELFRRTGKTERAEKQVIANRLLVKAVEKIAVSAK